MQTWNQEARGRKSKSEEEDIEDFGEVIMKNL